MCIRDSAWTVPRLAEAKAAGRRLAMLTAYDASFARVVDRHGVDLVLVGDSLGMVVRGLTSVSYTHLDVYKRQALVITGALGASITVFTLVLKASTALIAVPLSLIHI